MKLSDAEWQVMNALWKDHPATAREVGRRLPEDVNWAYTTLKTMLNRLVTKGAVMAAKQGNVSVYEPLVSQRTARRSALQRLKEIAFGGSVAPLVSFLSEDEELTDSQRRELARILDAEDADGRES